MQALTIREKLYDYIRVADDKKVKAIYTILENDIEEAYDFWNDKDFIAQLETRSEAYNPAK